jgi:hypothetical protein
MDNECLTKSTHIDGSDSLLGACQVFRIVGKNPMTSIRDASITDQRILSTKSHGRMETKDKAKHTLSKFVMSLVP